MPKVKVVLNEGAVRSQLLKSSAILGQCMGVARKMAADAGPGYAVDYYSASTRNVAVVYPITAAASLDNLKTNPALKDHGGKTVKAHYRHLANGKTVLVREHVRGG